MSSASYTTFVSDFFNNSSSRTASKESYRTDQDSATNSPTDDYDLDRKLIDFAGNLSQEYKEKNAELESKVDVIKRDCEKLKIEKNNLETKANELKADLDKIDRFNIKFVGVSVPLFLAGAFALYSHIDGKFERITDNINDISNITSVNTSKISTLNGEFAKVSNYGTNIAILQQSVKNNDRKLTELTLDTKRKNDEISTIKSLLNTRNK